MVPRASQVLRALHRPRHRHGQRGQPDHRIHAHPRGEHHRHVQRKLRAGLEFYPHSVSTIRCRAVNVVVE